MYADRITGSMERALAETSRRRDKQLAYNAAHGITPETIRKNVADVLDGLFQGDTDQARVTARIDKPLIGANLAAHLDGFCARRCSRRPRTSSSRKPPASATRSSGWKRSSWRWPTIRWLGNRRLKRKSTRR
jgi:hypothetical protein